MAAHIETGTMISLNYTSQQLDHLGNDSQVLVLNMNDEQIALLKLLGEQYIALYSGTG